MEYLIPIVLVLLLVTGFITFLVLNATRKSKPSEAESSGENDPRTMAATDASPFGDTTEHAGEQSGQGETVDDPEHAVRARNGGEREGGRAEPSRSGGGTAHAPRPQSEELANRPEV
jgi:hypothetical protein